MKKIISISLGSPKGDHQACIELLGEQLTVERKGTGGNLQAAVSLLKELDGQVDAFGLGGINFNYSLGRRMYPIREVQFLIKAVTRTPLVDGSIIKEQLERRAVKIMVKEGLCRLEKRRVLVVSALDRYPLAEALAEAGARVTVGDAMFGLGLPISFSLKSFNFIGRWTMPVLRHLPLSYLYPLGDKQNQIKPKFRTQYEQADILAGDFHFIHRHMPDNLGGKTIITSTVRPDEVLQLKDRGLSRLITIFPAYGGRFFGANVMEAALTAILGHKLDQLDEPQWAQLIHQLQWRPVVTELNRERKLR